MTDSADIGDALRAAVAAHLAAHPGATVASLARDAGLRQPNLHRALQPGAVVRQPTVTALCTAMGLRVAFVPAGVAPPTPQQPRPAPRTRRPPSPAPMSPHGLRTRPRGTDGPAMAGHVGPADPRPGSAGSRMVGCGVWLPETPRKNVEQRRPLHGLHGLRSHAPTLTRARGF